MSAGALPAAAHDAPIRGYGRISAAGDSLTWTLYFDPTQLDTFMHLDADGDGAVNEAEVDAQSDAIRDMAEPAVQATDTATDERPDGATGTIDLVDLAATGLHSEGFADLTDVQLVEVPVTFTFSHLDLPAVQLTYDLFTNAGFGEHINIAEVDLDGQSQVFMFDPGAPAFLVGELLGLDASDTASTGVSDAGSGDASSGGSGSGSGGGSGGSAIAPIALGVAAAGLAGGFALKQRSASRRRALTG